MGVSRGRIGRVECVVVGATIASFLTGCRDATSIELTISTDLPCEQVRVVSTSIGSGSLETYESRPPGAVTTRCDDSTGYIGSLVLLPSAQNDDTEIAIRVVTARSNKAPEECLGGTSAECIVARRVVRFVPNRLVTLPIRMQNVCSGVVCGPTQTCNAGHCVSALASIATCPPEGCEARLDDEPPSITDGGVPSPAAPNDTVDASPAPPDAAPDPVDAGAKKKPPKGGKEDQGDNVNSNTNGQGNGNGNAVDAGQGPGGVISSDASVSPDVVGASDAGASNDDDDDDDGNGNGNRNRNRNRKKPK